MRTYKGKNSSIQRDKGIPYSEMAVLFRTNTQARTLSSKLMEFNIPFCYEKNVFKYL